MTTTLTNSDGTTCINVLSRNAAYVTTRLEQMDQLWIMDTMGYVRSAFDHGRCLTVPSSSIDGGVVVAEAPVEIGPCGGAGAISRFYYPPNAVEFVGGAVPKLRLRGHEEYCVTYLGGDSKPTKGAPVVLGLCPVSATVTEQEEDEKFGWDFVSERDLVEFVPTVAPTSIPLPLGYLGRDACSPSTPCHKCMWDCDTNDD